MNNILHVYAAEQWHCDVDIVGDRKSLTSLRDAIDRVLKQKHPAKAMFEAYVNDGEGYELTVYLTENKDRLDNLAVPYTEEYAKEKNEKAIWPINLFEDCIMQELQLYFPSKEEMDKWLDTPNKSFQDKCPRSASLGELEAMLIHLESGVN